MFLIEMPLLLSIAGLIYFPGISEKFVKKHDGIKVYPHTPHTILNEFPISSPFLICDRRCAGPVPQLLVLVAWFPFLCTVNRVSLCVMWRGQSVP